MPFRILVSLMRRGQVLAERGNRSTREIEAVRMREELSVRDNTQRLRISLKLQKVLNLLFLSTPKVRNDFLSNLRRLKPR